MHVATFQCRYGALEPLSAELYGLGTLGIQETELTGDQYELTAYFDERFDASLMDGFTGWREDNAHWETDWKADWQPIEAGTRLWLAPHWVSDAPPPGRLRLDVYPGQGSGTGYSEPTLLMLEALEQTVRVGDVAADIGTGSGILLAAAKALGAARLLGCDVETEAAAEARAHYQADVWAGSPRSLASNVATLVIANLNAITLESLAAELQRIRRPQSRLLIGGFTERSAAKLEKLFGPPQATYSRGNWRVFSYSDTITT